MVEDERNPAYDTYPCRRQAGYIRQYNFVRADLPRELSGMALWHSESAITHISLDQEQVIKNKILSYWKNLVLGLLLLIAGIILIWGDMDGWLSTQQNLWLNVGCSLMASAIVILATALLIERKPNSLLQEWGLSTIYAKRNAKESDNYKDLKRTRECIDIIAFGLRTFRSDKKNVAEIERYLSDGGSIRILTMNPTSKFIEQRETEENSAKDHIRKSIEELVTWADELNSKSPHGKIIVKGYDCMTLDFYWRLDDVLYVGSYPYGCESDQAPTYRYTKGGKGFELYSDYFKSLWNNENFIELTSM